MVSLIVVLNTLYRCKASLFSLDFRCLMRLQCYYFYLVIASVIIFVTVMSTVDGGNIVGAQIESNSTFTTCINGKCVTTTTICIINQPCHTVRSNSTNSDNNNSTGNNIMTTPFSQGTI